MQISLLSRRYIQILIIVIVLISFISIIWHYEQSITKHQSIIRNYEQSIANHQSSIQSLQAQLTAQKSTNQQLIENIGQIQAAWKVTETELQELLAMDWEEKNADAREENEFLHKKINELKYQYDIDIARLQRAQSFLSAQNNSMRDFHVQLEEINHGLEQNIAKLESNIKLQSKTIANLESEIKQHKQSIASLQKPAPEPPTVQPSTAKMSTGEEDKSDVYRHVRLQSLNNAMINQDSVARKNILVSVIPTIPNGVSGDEFLSLVAGMKSEDILSAIQLTNKYITRPLDSKTISALTGILNEKDAEAVSLIFKTKE